MVAHLTIFHGKREDGKLHSTEMPSMIGHKTLTKDQIKIKDQTTIVVHLTSVHDRRAAGTLHSVTADLITNPEIPKQCVNQDGEATTEQSLPHTADIEKSADRKAGPRQYPVKLSNSNTVRKRSSNRQINITKTFNQEPIN